ncbi:MAG: hypothetical protein ACPGOY_15385 [Rhodospirillaceae bacterium]
MPRIQIALIALLLGVEMIRFLLSAFTPAQDIAVEAYGEAGHRVPQVVYSYDSRENNDVPRFRLAFEARSDSVYYGNFFQTSNTSQAIRLEIQPTSEVFLLQQEAQATPVGQWAEGKWHRISIVGTREEITVSIDHQPSVTVPILGSPLFDHMVLGSGLGMQRPLDGEMRDISLSIIVDPYRYPAAAASAVLAITFALFLFNPVVRARRGIVAGLALAVLPGLAVFWSGIIHPLLYAPMPVLLLGLQGLVAAVLVIRLSKGKEWFVFGAFLGHATTLLIASVLFYAMLPFLGPLWTGEILSWSMLLLSSVAGAVALILLNDRLAALPSAGIVVGLLFMLAVAMAGELVELQRAFLFGCLVLSINAIGMAILGPWRGPQPMLVRLWGWMVHMAKETWLPVLLAYGACYGARSGLAAWAKYYFAIAGFFGWSIFLFLQSRSLALYPDITPAYQTEYAEFNIFFIDYVLLVITFIVPGLFYWLRQYASIMRNVAEKMDIAAGYTDRLFFYPLLIMATACIFAAPSFFSQFAFFMVLGAGLLERSKRASDVWAAMGQGLEAPVVQHPDSPRPWHRPRFLLPVLSVLLLGQIALGAAAWYPVALPNDEFELRGLQALSSEHTLSPEALDSNMAHSASWLAWPGRVIHHHSYNFVTAAYLATYGIESPMAYLYGFGNSSVFAALFLFAEPTLSTYFNAYPIFNLTGLLLLGLVVGYAARSKTAGLVAASTGLACLYAIGFESFFMAVSFNVLRYAGTCIQIAAIFYAVRTVSENKAILALLGSTLFSLVWNVEYGVLGFAGQAVLLLAPSLRWSLPRRLCVLFLLMLAVMAVLPFRDLVTGDRLDWIKFGFFGIAVPPFPSAIFPIFLSITAGLVFTFCILNQHFEVRERDARLAVLVIAAFMMIKYVYNAAPNHLYYTLLFVACMALTALPWSPACQWRVGKGPLNPLSLSWVLLLALGVSGFAFANGATLLREAQQFKARMIMPFEAEDWSRLGETIRINIPGDPVMGRVSAIRETLDPEETLLILSPFDILMNFYVNPRYSCAHFDLLSSLYLLPHIDAVAECVRRTPNVLVVYDHALSVRCADVPDRWLSAIAQSTGCRIREQGKDSIAQIYELLAFDLVEVSRTDDLVFYRKKD